MAMVLEASRNFYTEGTESLFMCLKAISLYSDTKLEVFRVSPKRKVLLSLSSLFICSYKEESLGNGQYYWLYLYITMF